MIPKIEKALYEDIMQDNQNIYASVKSLLYTLPSYNRLAKCEYDFVVKYLQQNKLETLKYHRISVWSSKNLIRVYALRCALPTQNSTSRILLMKVNRETGEVVEYTNRLKETREFETRVEVI